MFIAWGTSIYRSTRDIDLLGFTTNELESVEKIFQELCDLSVEPDGLIFDRDSIKSERITEDADYQGVRIHLITYLGKAKIPLQIDIGFSDIVTTPLSMLLYPTFLAMPAPQLRGYPPESVVAEKLQALIFLGSINSCLKDFYELWIMAQHFEFDGLLLQKAILNTFKMRRTAFPGGFPVGLSESFALTKQTQWQAFVQRLNIENEPEVFSEIILILRNYLMPALHACASGAKLEGIWKPGGPWTGRN